MIVPCWLFYISKRTCHFTFLYTSRTKNY